MSGLCIHDNEKLINAVKERKIDSVVECMKTCSLSNVNWVKLFGLKNKKKLIKK